MRLCIFEYARIVLPNIFVIIVVAIWKCTLFRFFLISPFQKLKFNWPIRSSFSRFYQVIIAIVDVSSTYFHAIICSRDHLLKVNVFISFCLYIANCSRYVYLIMALQGKSHFSCLSTSHSRHVDHGLRLLRHWGFLSFRRTFCKTRLYKICVLFWTFSQILLSLFK